MTLVWRGRGVSPQAKYIDSKKLLWLKLSTAQTRKNTNNIK